MTNSRDKGKVGEREWVHVLRDHGYDAHRTQQHKGSKDSFDVVSLGASLCPVALWEVKRRQAFNLHDTTEQARTEAAGELFAVAHRKNGKRWLVTMDAEEFFRLLKGME